MMFEFLQVITFVLSIIIINGNLVFMSHGFYYGSSYCDTNGVSSFNRSCVGDYGLPIQSPFWISSGFVNPDGHGGCKAYPGFEVRCEGTKPVMNISNHRYYVKAMDSDLKSIFLVDVDVDGKGCPRPRHNFSLQSQPFLHYYYSSERLTIFYNCTIAPPPTTGIVVEIPCLENSYNTRRSYAFLPDYYNYKNRRSYAFQTNYNYKSAYAVPEGFHDWYNYCDESVAVPVDYHSNFTINATAALQKPFSLRWTLPLDCDDCVRRGSGGQCSANDTTGGGFRCQCKDGKTVENTICQGQEKKSSINIVAIVVPAVIAAVLLSIVTIFFCLRRKKGFVIVEDVDQISNVESLQLKLTTVAAATENFSEANKLGEGGFGPVYKGKLSDGQEIAVKRLSRNSGQGVAEFKNEILLLAKLQHRNLVRLLGFCLEGEEKLLIYEFVINASLDQFIFDPIKRTQLDWGKRYNIIGGIARGLLYLHEDSQVRIIHRDLKASNILLNDQMNPKISDFGTARLFMMDQTHANTRRIAGTFGYMPPEYVIHGHFSVKSDVFSFGVLVLELISGKKNTSLFETECADDLLCYAWRRWREGTALELLDPVLRDHYNENEVTRCIHIGLLCVQEDVAKRPTMATVVLMLSSYSVNLALPSPPPRYGSFTISGSMPHSNNEVSVTELTAR